MAGGCPRNYKNLQKYPLYGLTPWGEMCTIGHMKTKQTDIDTLFVESVKFLADYFRNGPARLQSHASWGEDVAFVDYLLDGIADPFSGKRIRKGTLKTGDIIKIVKNMEDIAGDTVYEGEYRVLRIDRKDSTVLLSVAGGRWVKARNVRSRGRRTGSLGYGMAKESIKNVCESLKMEPEALQIARGVW